LVVSNALQVLDDKTLTLKEQNAALKQAAAQAAVDAPAAGANPPAHSLAYGTEGSSAAQVRN
jgi:hypothetical protein